MKFIKNHIKWITFSFLMIVFVAQYLILGVRPSPDTVRFEAFSQDVYPLYPLVLYLFRTLLGAELGYNLLGLVQNVFLAAAIFSLIEYLRKTYHLNAFFYLLSAVVSSLVFFVQLLFTRAGIMSSNILFSEAISIPIYLYFFRYSLEAFLEKRKRPFIISCILALCLILTRGQLYWAVIIVFINGVCLADVSRRKALICAILACALIVGGVQGARYIQTINVRDEQTKSPVGFFLLTTAVYCSESDDALLFDEGSGERQLFDIARSAMDDPARLAAFSYETGGLTNRHNKFEDHYDDIKSILINSYQSLTAQGMSISVGDMTRILIFENMGAFILHCAQNGLVGLVRTVAILKPYINIFACLFLAFMTLFPIIIRKDPDLSKERKLIILAVVGTYLNALVMAPGVFALSRYVFYNMPTMYLSAIVLFAALLKKYAKKFTRKNP